jgi:hypothetical protein
VRGVDQFEVFFGGKRLRKNPIAAYDAALGMDSPEADIILPAEFSVSGSTLTLNINPAEYASDLGNTKIFVVRKIGKLWNNINVPLISTIPLSQTENEIARFIRAKEVTLPQ